MAGNRMIYDLMKYFPEMITKVNYRISVADICDDDPVIIQYCKGAPMIVI
jgi:hypothetical protein